LSLTCWRRLFDFFYGRSGP